MKPTVTRSVVALVVPLVFGSARTVSAAEESEPASETTAESSEKKSDGDVEASEEKSSESKDDEKKPDAAEESFGHGGQIGLRVGIVAGYRMILRYEDSPLCAEFDPSKGTDQQKFCGHAAPFAITPALSYGIADWLEPFAWGRFGLTSEGETATEPVMMLGAGLRVYTMSDAPFKIFIEPSLGLEFEDGQSADYKTDFVIHLAAGPTFDFARYFGAYLTGGITATILRGLATSLEAELGVQARY